MKAVLRALLAVFMVSIGIAHFARPGPFVQIMPGPLAPWALELVLVSGFFEVAGGVGLMIPRLRRAAGFGLVALYLAVFPANINMAINDITVNGTDLPQWALYARLPFQLVLIALALYVSAPEADQ